MDLDGHRFDEKGHEFDFVKPSYSKPTTPTNKPSSGGKKTSNTPSSGSKKPSNTPSGVYTSSNTGGGTSYGFDGGSSYVYVPPPPDPRQYYIINEILKKSASNEEATKKISNYLFPGGKTKITQVVAYDKTDSNISVLASVTTSEPSKSTQEAIINMCKNQMVDQYNEVKKDEKGFFGKLAGFYDEHKVAINIVAGLAVIGGLAIATAATGGAAAGVAGYVLSGALNGAIGGAVSGTVIGGAIGGLSSAIKGEDILSGAIEGASSGFASGAISGAILGGVKNGIEVANSSSMWTNTGSKSGYQQMVEHYEKHVLKEHNENIAHNIVDYTNQAIDYYNENVNLGRTIRDGVIKIKTKDGLGGFFDINGSIRSFWYK